MNELTAFLYEKEDPLPVLCGYFEKIFHKLMHQQKDVMKKFFFIEGKGKIFDAIINKMENHSVTMILMRLLEIEVRPPNFMRHDFYDRHDDYGSDDDDEGKDGDRRMHHMERRRMRKEPELSPE